MPIICSLHKRTAETLVFEHVKAKHTPKHTHSSQKTSTPWQGINHKESVPKCWEEVIIFTSTFFFFLRGQGNVSYRSSPELPRKKMYSRRRPHSCGTRYPECADSIHISFCSSRPLAARGGFGLESAYLIYKHKNPHRSEARRGMMPSPSPLLPHHW